MRLDRNTRGRQKYALIKLRDFEPQRDHDGHLISPQMVPLSVIDFGNIPDSEFFVIKLKDKNAYAALVGYADATDKDDREYATEILGLAVRAANHPGKKKPD
jgi:hypothetical protein